MLTTETQALNLKNSGGIFAILAWKNGLKWIAIPLSSNILLGIFLLMF